MKTVVLFSLVALLAAQVIGPQALAQAPAASEKQTEATSPTGQATDLNDPDFVRVENPAFPSPELHQVPIHRGRLYAREDLAPYFSSGPLLEAKRAFAGGLYQRARELIMSNAPTLLPGRYLAAQAAYRLNDDATAAAEFEALAKDYPQLKDRCLVHAGWSYEGVKKWADAKRMFEAVSKQSRMTVDAQIGLSRALMHLKDFVSAEAAIETLVKRPPPPWGRDVGAEALFQLADLYAAQRNTRKEKDALWRLWSEHPLAPGAARVEARLGDLSKVTDANKVARADALVDAHRNAQGLAMVEPMLEKLTLPNPVACRAHFVAGKALRKLRQHPRAIARLQPVAQQCADTDIRARALYTIGFSQSVVAPVASAVTYGGLAKQLPEHSFADDALFFAGEGAMRAGDTEQATTAFVELINRYPTGDFTADALFRLFWLARGKGALEEGLLYLEEIETRSALSDDTYEGERARYWRGRTLEQLGRIQEASVLFRENALEHPATYFGLVSRERYEAIAPEGNKALHLDIETETVDPFPIYAGPLDQDPQFLSAVELLRMGFGELVPMELLAVDRTSLPAPSIRLMVLMLSLSGEERSAHGMARLWLRKDLSGRITKENRAIWEIAYPKVFRELVVKHATAADELDPDLLQGLMREESALDPKALSWAGAMGLCQLMPPTAAEVAAKLKLSHPTRSQLLEPDLNIQLGARYLADLLIRAKGVKQFALAGYNAGERSVSRWRQEFGDADLAEWAEQIPVQETRGYVKRVLRSYNTYKLLYAPADRASTVSTFSAKPKKPGS